MHCNKLFVVFRFQQMIIHTILCEKRSRQSGIGVVVVEHDMRSGSWTTQIIRCEHWGAQIVHAHVWSRLC